MTHNTHSRLKQNKVGNLCLLQHKIVITVYYVTFDTPQSSWATIHLSFNKNVLAAVKLPPHMPFRLSHGIYEGICTSCQRTKHFVSLC